MSKNISMIIKPCKTYCLSCKKDTEKIGSKNVIMTNEVINKCQNVLIVLLKNEDF